MDFGCKPSLDIMGFKMPSFGETKKQLPDDQISLASKRSGKKRGRKLTEDEKYRIESEKKIEDLRT